MIDLLIKGIEIRLETDPSCFLREEQIVELCSCSITYNFYAGHRFGCWMRAGSCGHIYGKMHLAETGVHDRH